MTDGIAFHGDPAVKAQALAKLRRHIAAGTFVYFPAWEDGKANVIGAIVEADDTPRYAEMLGYPIALAETLPKFINDGFRPQDAAAAFAEAWLERTPVGADLSRIVSQLALALLDDADLAAITGRHPELEHCRLGILDLHRRVVGGETPDRKAWKTHRLAAVAATDGLGDAELDRLAGNVVEAAAWPGTMRTVLRDTLSASGSLHLRRSLVEIGWTMEDESRVFHIREQAEKDGYKAEFSGLDRLFAILDADHPALAGGFRARLQQMEGTSARCRALAWQAVELMEQAPIVAPSPMPTNAEA
ncbi:hypothetical protein [uncultured Sphingomonas sp.]|uniref:hypothetical protein n=1 Tax=uncultured Sphingomonas sp. TaxID=158754 RepID=UPI0025D8CF1C|nr:hypothetical protein [uncultured Sphingomonas sp.]